MAETILALVGSILAIVLWALKKHDETAPQRAENHRDEHLATPDLDAVSVDLDRLFVKAGGPPGQPSTQGGHSVPDDQRQPDGMHSR